MGMVTKTINVLDKGYVQLISYMGNDLSVVHAARVSLNKDILGSQFKEDKDGKLIKYLLENKHTSPLEHVVFTFLVKCPLFIRSQWHRHRTWSYNEISRRYTSEDIDFYIPSTLRRQAENNRQASSDEMITELKTINPSLANRQILPVDIYISDISRLLYAEYVNLLEQGVSREQARIILPQNLYTRFYGTVNLWNLLHFIELRNDPHSQYEMQLYGNAVESLATEVVPNTMEIWKELKSHD